MTFLYRSPNSPKENDNEFVKVMETTKKLFNLGDFNTPNIDFISGVSDNKGLPLLNAVENRFLHPLKDFTTHKCGNVLDLAFTDLADSILAVTDIGNLGNSDHSIIKIEMNICPEFNRTSELVCNWRGEDQ